MTEFSEKMGEVTMHPSRKKIKAPQVPPLCVIGESSYMAGNLIALTALAPTLVLVVVFFVSPLSLNAGRELDTAFFWSTGGALASYYGLLISLFALIEIRLLSNRHYFKVRSPEMQKQLVSLAKEISNSDSEPVSSLQSQSFMSKLPTAVRLARRLKNSEINKLARDIDRAFKIVQRSARKKDLPDKCGQLTGYWDMYQKVQELSEEVRSQIADMKAA